MNVPMNVLIVDDEPLAREGMQLLLKEEPSITSVTEARNGAEAVRLIRERRPGPGVSRRADARAGRLRRAAHRRRRAHAAGDLRDRARSVCHPGIRSECDRLSAEARHPRALLAGAGAGARTDCQQGADNQHVLSLLQQLAAAPKYLARVALRSAGRISFVNVEDILYVQAAENYVQLHLKSDAPPAARAHRHVRKFTRSADVPAHPSLLYRQRETHPRARDRCAWRIHRGSARRHPAAGQSQLSRKDQGLGVQSLLKQGRRRCRDMQSGIIFATIRCARGAP